MRVTHKSTFIPYQRNLDEIQNRKFKEEIRLSTGKAITSLSDNPSHYVDSKIFTSKIQQNENYKNIIEDALSELRATEESLEFISDNVRKIREIAIDATQIGNSGNTFSLSVYIKGILKDIIKQANTDFNGKYLFAGTKTTPASYIEEPDIVHMTFGNIMNFTIGNPCECFGSGSVNTNFEKLLQIRVFGVFELSFECQNTVASCYRSIFDDLLQNFT